MSSSVSLSAPFIRIPESLRQMNQLIKTSIDSQLNADSMESDDKTSLDSSLDNNLNILNDNLLLAFDNNIVDIKNFE